MAWTSIPHAPRLGSIEMFKNIPTLLKIWIYSTVILHSQQLEVRTKEADLYPKLNIPPPRGDRFKTSVRGTSGF